MDIIRANAKINWSLDVLFRRVDGYHELETLMQQISLYDELKIAENDEMSLMCDKNDIPINQNNTIIKAIELYFAHSGMKKNFKIDLTKNIPSQAGLGGGSSDAAAMLKYLNARYNLKTKEQLKIIAKQVGADVPFFLADSTFALCKGIGEKITALKAKEYSLLLVKPDEGISTAELFSGLSLNSEKTSCSDALTDAICNYNFLTMKQLAKNDLQNEAIRKCPSINIIIEKIYNSGAKLALMSGAGSCCFGVFSSEQEAKKAQFEFSDYYNELVNTI